MNLRIRQVDLVADRQELLSVLQRNLQDVPHESRLSWMYLGNPAGFARSWFLCDADGSAVGVTSLFPRAVWLDGKAEVCGQVGDFGVDARFRSLGPALMLQRATFEPVLENAIAFCYDCPPHELGMAMFYRLGLEENCRMQPFVKPPRADRHLQRLLGSTAGRVASRMANPVLRLNPRPLSPCHGVEFALHQGDFDQEFSAVDEAVPACGSIRNRRSADDLNWRFRRDPVRQFEVLTARRAGELLAYVIFTIVEEDALIFDLFGRDLKCVGTHLLQALTDMLYGRPLQTLRAVLTCDDLVGRIFGEAGFSPRGHSTRVVAFGGAKFGCEDALLHTAHWQFQHSDVVA